MTDTRILGMGQPPPPPPPGPPHHHGGGHGFGPMMFPQYQPVQPTVYIERQAPAEAPCKWYEDLQGAGDVVACRAPAVWLVIAAVGAGTLWAMTRRSR